GARPRAPARRDRRHRVAREVPAGRFGMERRAADQGHRHPRRLPLDRGPRHPHPDAVRTEDLTLGQAVRDLERARAGARRGRRSAVAGHSLRLAALAEAVGLDAARERDRPGMSANVEGLLKDLQNAIGSRALYPADHPRTREGVARIEKQLDDLTALSGELSVFAVEDKVVHAGAAIPGSEPIARGLFRILRASGYDRLTIRRGVSRDEIDRFLALPAEAAKRADSPAPGAVTPSTNIRLSAFRGASPAELNAPLTEDEFLHEEVQALGDVWSGVVEKKTLDVGSV